MISGNVEIRACPGISELGIKQGMGKSNPEIYTLLVQVGRKSNDGLPDGSTGAGLLCFSAGRDEAEAVRETVAILRTADMAPLDVTGYGTLDDRLKLGHDISDDEIDLMNRAAEENAVIVVQMIPFFGEEDEKDWQLQAD